MITSYMENTARKTFLTILATLIAILAMTIGLAPPAHASLSKVGPINPDNGYPYWYEDANGTRLDLCLDNTAASKCLRPFEMPNPDGAISFPENFPGEAFWWTGEASTTLDNGADALLVTAVEAAFANENPVDGDQMSFGRVRIRVDGLDAGQQYRVSHPFGTKLFTAEPVLAGSSVGEINETIDIGCFPTPQTRCDFNEALSGQPGPFLKWTEGAPAGYLGDPDVPHAVTGSVIMDDQNSPQNYFKIEKVNADGTFTQIGFTDQFVLTGKLATLQVGATPRDALSNDPQQKVELVASDPAPETRIYYTTDGTTEPGVADPVSGEVSGTLYAGPITLPSNAGEVTDTNLKFVAIKGDQRSEVVTKKYTVDRQAPHLTATPGSGVYEDTQNVELNTSEPAKIYYTTDGSSPVGANNDITGTEYTGAIELKRSARINAVAVDDANNRSRVETFSYDIASVAKLGPTNPQGGYPFWYQDKNGVKLDECLDNSATSKCLVPFEMPDPDGTMSFPENYPGEAFWWTGEASVDRPGAKRTLLVMAMEAAFANENPVDGDQMSFGRIRIRLDALDAGSQYRITHPYGVDTFTAEPSPKNPLVGEINVTEDIGCFPTPTTRCNFNDARFGRVGPFLTWTDFGNGTDADPTTIANPALADAAGNPDRYVGDPAVEHAVKGSPYGTNLFKVEKLKPDGSVESVIANTDQFAVSGKVAEFQVGASRKGGSFNKPQDVTLGASEEGSEIYYTTNGDVPVDDAGNVTNGKLYTGKLTFNENTTLKFRALGPVPADGSPRAVSPLYTETYVIDTTAPTVTATPDGGTFENDPPTVTLTANEPAKIYFTKTTDGSEPPAPVPGNANTTLYNDPIKITTDTKLKFMAIDTAGNQSADVTKTYTIIDTIAPNAPTLNLDAASDTGASSTDGNTSDTTPKFTGKAEAGSTVEVFDGATSLGTATAGIGTADADGNKGWELTVSADKTLADGDRNITATATDAAGNRSDPPATLSITVDTTAPNTSIASGPTGTVNSTSASFGLSSTEPEGARFQCSIDGAAFTACSSPRTYTGLAPNRSHTFRARATDVAGNIDATPVSRTWTIDTVRPTVTRVTPANGVRNVAATTNVTATFSERMTNVNRTTFRLVGGGTTVNATVTLNAAGTQATLNPARPLRNGVRYTATVVSGANGVKDVAGNALAANKTWSFTIRP